MNDEGINDDDLDIIDDDLISTEELQDQDPPQIDDQTQQESQNDMVEEDFVSLLLKQKGIEDKSKIKFQNDEGEVEELNWDNLSNEDRLNIFSSLDDNNDTELEDDEIQLINTIRNSGLTTAEYLQHIQENSVNNYIQNNQNNIQYLVDQYNDDELFVADYISRMGDVTEEEANSELERAKSNMELFNKQIGAIRKEYKMIEDENNKQAQLEQEQIAQEQFEEFSNSVVDEINDFSEFSGYDLNMEQDDMQELYDFITGTDAAGNNHFAKALSDPKILVRTAWFSLNGEQMINDITEYFQKEITNVRKESYKKGVEDTQKKINQSNFVYKEKQNKSSSFADLDDFE